MFKRNYSSNTSHYKGTVPKSAFTFLEILLALSIIAVLFLPMMRLFSHALHSTSHSKDLITAANLAQWQMERIKNLAITKEQVQALGNSIYPEGNKPALIVNETAFRIKQIIKDSDPLEIQIEVYRDGEMDKLPLMALVTLIEDTIWEEKMGTVP